jgi:hypothetical protein
MRLHSNLAAVLAAGVLLIGCGSEPEEIPLLSAVPGDAGSPLEQPVPDGEVWVWSPQEIEVGEVPTEVCPLPRPKTIAAIFGSAVEGVPEPGPAGPGCRWSRRSIDLTVTATSAVGYLEKFRAYDETHHSVDSPSKAGFGSLSRDGETWGLAIARLGTYFEVAGAPTRRDALALGDDLIGALEHP